jgi:hypothetical protein
MPLTTSEKSELEALRKQLGFYKDRLKRFRHFKGGESSAFWTALKKDIELSIDANLETEKEAKHDRAKPSNERLAIIDQCVGAERAYRAIIANVDGCDAKMDGWNQAIARISERITQLTNKIEDPSAKAQLGGVV